MPREFDGRQVLVSGGTGALGSAVVGRLLGQGASIVVPVFDEAELENFAHRDNERVTLVPNVDLREPDQVDRVFAEAGALWASVHVAGGFAYAPLADAGKDTLDRMLGMNAVSAYLCTRAAALGMRKTGGGRIVNVAARNVLFPELGANMAAYTMSKAAVAAMTQALGAELADEGVLINAVLPGVMDTPANRSSMPDADHSDWTSVDDVASTIEFLASPLNTATRSALVPVYRSA